MTDLRGLTDAEIGPDADEVLRLASEIERNAELQGVCVHSLGDLAQQSLQWFGPALDPLAGAVLQAVVERATPDPRPTAMKKVA